MTTRRALLAATLIPIGLATPLWAQDAPIPVVATFSILGDMVGQIGGEHIALTTLVGPDGDAHVYSPTPQDAAALAQAEVLFVNGLEFEGWIDRLVEASGFDGTRVVAAAAVEPISFEEDDHDDDHGDHDDHDDHAEGDHDHEHGEEEHADGDHDHDHGEEMAEGKDDHDHDHGDEMAEAGHDDDHEHGEHGHDEHAGHDHHGHDHGAFDPHAWQSGTAAIAYADAIAAALSVADPENAGSYFANRAAFVAEVEAVDAEIRELIAALPEEARTVVTSHDAFGYFERDYGIEFLAPQGLSTASEASAADVAALIEQIRDEGIAAVFVENITDSRLVEQIASETGAVVGGTLFSDALSDADGPAGTYLDMMRHNARTIAGALGS